MSATLQRISHAQAASTNQSPQSNTPASIIGIHQIILNSRLIEGQKIVQIEEWYKANNGKLNVKDGQGYTPLMLSAKHGYINIFKKLIAMGVDPRETGFHKRTAFHIAAENGQLEIVKEVAKRPADGGYLDQPLDNEGNTPLILAARKGHVAVCKYLIQTANADPKTKGFNKRNFVHHAAFCGAEGVINLATKELAEELESNGDTPVVIAAFFGCEKACKALLDMGVDFTSKRYQDRTPLHNATLNGNRETVELLLGWQNGKALVNAVDRFGNTPLHLAAKNIRDPSVFRVILTAGGDPGIKNKEGRTPLHEAAEVGLLNGIELICNEVKYKHLLDLEDNEGMTPLQIAEKKGHRQIVECLQKAGAKKKSKEEEGKAGQEKAKTPSNPPASTAAASGATPKSQILEFIGRGNVKYRICPTLGDGACAIHAVLGTKIDNEYSINTPRKTFIDRLEAQINANDPKLKICLDKVLISYIQDMINISPGFDKKYVNMIYNGFSIRLKEELVKTLSQDEKDLSELRAKENTIIDKLATTYKEQLKSVLNCTDVVIANRKYLHTVLSNLDNTESFVKIIGDEAEQYLKNRAQLQAANTKRDTISKQLLETNREEIIKAYKDACLLDGISGYWFSDQDIKLLELLFNKRVEIYIREGILAHVPDEALQGDLVVLYNSGQSHYSRCESIEGALPAGIAAPAAASPIVSELAKAVPQPQTPPKVTVSSQDVKGMSL